MSIKKEKSEAAKLLEKITGGPMTLSRLIRAIRLGEDETLAKFAKQLGISRQHLCDIEQGRKLVSAARAARFAETLGYSQHRFVKLALQAQLDEAKLKFVVDVHAA